MIIDVYKDLWGYIFSRKRDVMLYMYNMYSWEGVNKKNKKSKQGGGGGQIPCVQLK